MLSYDYDTSNGRFWYTWLMINFGSNDHHRILRALADLFHNDANIEAFAVFGSLVRGDWDKYSDLDLDAVVTYALKAKIYETVVAMENALSNAGLKTLLHFEESPNQWVFIFQSLDRISIRFHVLEETSPNIIDSCIILTGKLTKEDLAQAAASKPKQHTDFELRQNKFIEHVIYVPIYVHRGELINALNMLDTLRNSLLTIYCTTHGLSKIEKFERNAPESLKEALVPTFAQLEVASIKSAFASLVRLYTSSIEMISAGKVRLSNEQRVILEKSLSY